MSDVEGFIQYRWGRYSLDEIWAMVAHEDGTVTAAQVQAWRRMTELCQDQATALKQAVDQLFHRWPPRPESAAAAFRDRIHDLIKSMQDSADHASTMPDPLWKITNQLTMTRYDILELLRQRAAAEEIERSQDTTHGYNGKAGGRPEPDALPANWRDQFDQKAREIMTHTEAVITQAATKIQAPNPYRIGDRTAETSVPVEGGSPLVGRLAGSAIPSGSSVGTASRDRGVAEPSFTPQGDSLDPTNVGDSPVLAGSVDHTHATVSPFSGILGMDGPSRTGTDLAPGGVIGGLPNPSNGGGPRSTNTPIAGRPASGATANSAGQAPMVTPMSGRPLLPSHATGGVRAGGRRRFRRDGEEPWGGRAGVPAILEPAPEPSHHDPGPGVIGLDR